MKTKIGLCLISAFLVSNAFALNGSSHPLKVASVLSSSESSSKEVKDTKSVKKSDESTVSKDVKKTKEYLSDSEITTKVKAKFIEEKLFGKDKISAMGISVKTKKGVVTLSGNVPSQDEIDNVVKLAKSVDGVKDVDSKLKVKVKAVKK